MALYIYYIYIYLQLFFFTPQKVELCCDPYDPNWFSGAHLVEIHALGHAGRSPGSQVGK